MCGRYTLTDPDPRLLRFRFGLTESVEIEHEPRYNVAPTDPVLAVRLTEKGEREPGMLRWGLIPHYADPEDFDRLLINARAETVAEAPAFRDAFQSHRCLVVADGFYEWRQEETGRKPVWITRPVTRAVRVRRPLGGSPPGRRLISALLRDRHLRAGGGGGADPRPHAGDPRAGGRGGMARAGGGPAIGSQALLVPTDDLAVTEVSDAVNDVRQDGPALIEPPLRLF